LFLAAWNRFHCGYLPGMKAVIPVLILTGALLAWCGEKKTATPAQATNTPTADGNPITAPVDYLGAVGQAQKQAAKVVDLVQVQQAVRQFQAAEARLPKDLEELIKEGYLPALPELPAGLKFEYNARTGEVKAVPSQ
jgi:hypothetical protein